MGPSAEILELGAILLVASAAGWLARRFRLPAVLGYLAVGVAVSPFTPGYVADRDAIALLAELGVVLLLFEIGIEINLGQVRREQRRLVVAAPLQVCITTLVAGGIFVAAGVALTTAAVLGLAVALSSGVVIVNIVRSRRRRTDRATEMTMLTWSGLQDITGVLLGAVLLSFAGTTDRSPLVAIAGLGGYLLAAAAAAWLLPRALRRLGAEPDLFLIVTIGVGLGLAGLGAVAFGLPAALAAFIAGLAVAESPVTVSARRQLAPFRDVFAVMFFVSIGTFINPQAAGPGLVWMGLAVLGLVVGKVVVTAGLARWAGAGRPWQVAVGMGQIGELSFVLAALLAGAGLLADEQFAGILGAVVVTIAASTVLVRTHWSRDGAAVQR